jgi:hypothetical protein
VAEIVMLSSLKKILRVSGVVSILPGTYPREAVDAYSFGLTGEICSLPLSEGKRQKPE